MGCEAAPAPKPSPAAFGAKLDLLLPWAGSEVLPGQGWGPKRLRVWAQGLAWAFLAKIERLPK